MTSPLWHWLEPRASGGEFEHFFCGPAAGSMPPCPNCRAPLLVYAQFDPRDRRLGLGELGVAQVNCVFCWRCALAQAPLHYRLSAEGSVELLSFGRGAVEVDFPYPDYPRAFPRAALVLVEPTPRELGALEQIRAGALWHDLEPDLRHLLVPRHRAGPGLASQVRSHACALCGKAMTGFAVFGNSNLDPRGFTGSESAEVGFQACVACAAVAAVQWCD
ncbi:MAG: hypothetical protein IPK67_07120 [Planctomycetes bacterium]|nr:hypothetical protein [Planctomycetota bacterium]